VEGVIEKILAGLSILGIPPGRKHLPHPANLFRYVRILSANHSQKFCSHTVQNETHGVHLHLYRNPIELNLLILQYGVVQRQAVLLVRDGEELAKMTAAPEKQVHPGQVAVVTKVKE
jgi:hypothetical protein